MSKIILSPSLLSCDFLHIHKDLITLNNKNIEYLHLDVMDGHFVNNISFGIPVINAISKIKNELNFKLDTHLMISNPRKYLQNFIDAGSDMLSIHLEIDDDIEDLLKFIKSKNVEAGIVINPETESSKIFPYLKYCDFVLIMSVHPGFGGQKFISDSLDKIEKIHNKIKEEGLKNIKICVDGGINLENAYDVLKKGANYLVAGSSVFKGDISANIDAFYDIISKYEGDNK